MTGRRLESWLDSYVRYASVTEAPRKMAFWAGVSTIAGALRRKVWIDMKRFKWYCNFYIIFVAPPGVVGKTTNMDMALGLLRKVPGINFGPDSVTWEKLTVTFSESCESFAYGEEYLPMSAITLASGEMGSLIDLTNRGMVMFYIDLWDGKNTYEKSTKTSGDEMVEAPWINMIACTTPHSLASNLPQNAIGGGFTSRCVWLYTEEKEKYIPFVDEVVDNADEGLQEDLLHDLIHISANLCGPFTITKEARDWYRPLYEDFWKTVKDRMDTTALEGYAARKQTLLFKTAMIVSASSRDTLDIRLEDLQLAYLMLESLEDDMNKVFSKVGQTDVSIHVERFLEILRRKGTISYTEAYRAVHTHFPDAKDFEGMVQGVVRSGYVVMENTAAGFMLRYNKEDR